MNKESIIAILLGFTGGILVAFLLVTAPSKLSFLNRNSQDNTKDEQVKSAQTADKPDSPITITSPLENSYIEGESVTIEGSVKNGDQVIVNGPLDDYIFVVKEDQTFTGSVDLHDGENNIFFTIFENSTTNPQTQKLVLYVSEESL